MKTIIVSLLALLASVVAVADDYKYLNAENATGGKSVELRKVKKITFSEGNVVISVVDGDAVVLPMADVKRISFSNEAIPEDDPTSVSEIAATMTGVVCVYDLKGQLVGIVNAAQGQIVSLHSLPSGVYIVKNGNSVVKVQK